MNSREIRMPNHTQPDDRPYARELVRLAPTKAQALLNFKIVSE